MAFNPTDEQRANLAKLADYLAALPADYSRFDMEVHAEDAEGFGISPRDTAKLNACGTCACAIGHGPAIGIEAIASDHRWEDYSNRVFGADAFMTAEGCYMFGPDNPNDPHAAADRIRKVLSGEFQA